MLARFSPSPFQGEGRGEGKYSRQCRPVPLTLTLSPKGNGIKGLNIVMKLFRCKMIEKDRWNECIKLSDVAGKHTGSVEEIQLAQRVLGISG